jgi:hypothetical protein
MTRFRDGGNGTSYLPPGSFVTVQCLAQSHEAWGIQTFTRGEYGWSASSNLQLPAPADAAGRQLRQRGDRDSMERLTADGEPLPELPTPFDVANGHHQEEVARRYAPGVYDRITLRCPRCGDGFPVKWGKLTKALDVLAATGEPFLPLSAVRRAVNELRA